LTAVWRLEYHTVPSRPKPSRRTSRMPYRPSNCSEGVNMRSPVEAQLPSAAVAFSTTVRIELRIDGEIRQVAQSADDWLILSTPEPVRVGPGPTCPVRR
jgi:hypothetical protein